jgi:hypothetical protein
MKVQEIIWLDYKYCLSMQKFLDDFKTLTEKAVNLTLYVYFVYKIK